MCQGFSILVGTDFPGVLSALNDPLNTTKLGVEVGAHKVRYTRIAVSEFNCAIGGETPALFRRY